MKQYIISDIHGCCKTFKSLLKKIKFSKKDELYLLGDYIDRGKDSKGVIDHIWKLQINGFKVHCLKGNHEELMINAFKDEQSQLTWISNGGLETAKSFDMLCGNIPHKYLDWMENLPTYLVVDKFILVHAGLNFQISDPLSDDNSLIWIRNWYDQIDYDWLGDRYIIHGHSAFTKDQILNLHSAFTNKRVLNIDAGCVFGARRMGYLVCYELKSGKIIFEKR